MLTEGTVLAGYRIERLLGAGGMGSVYLAAHPNLPRRTALKVLSPEYSRDPAFRARFLREADVAAGLDHPNIVAVYDRGQADTGELWIAMQFVDGTDADAALRPNGITPQRAVHIVGEVARALDYAHSRQIVHRDIKPANFLLSGPPGPQERVLLGDFGIARALDDYGLTATGSVLATVSYAAPEVLSGEPFDGRADVYSLGCSLFRLLTGQTPFATTNGMAAVMMAHLNAPPPQPSARVPTLPAALDDVVAVALAKRPEQRFPTATALAEAAAAALHGASRAPGPPATQSRHVTEHTRTGPWPGDAAPLYPPIPQGDPTGTPTRLRPAPPSPPRRSRRRALTAVAVIAVVAAGVGVGVAVWPDADPPGSENTAEPPAAREAPPPAGGAPATDVPTSALRGILLPASQLRELTGADLVLDGDRSEVVAEPAEVGNPQCVSVWTPAQPAAFEGDSSVDRDVVTGAAVQTLRALNTQPWQDGVSQAAVTVADSPNSFLRRQQRRWAACAAGGPVQITTPQSAPQTWTFSPPATSAGIVTVDYTTAGATCQHGVAVRGNVILDVRQCRPQGGNDVAAIINALGERVPRG